MRAIETLKSLGADDRTPSDDEIRALAAYAGWGGAADAFRDEYPESMGSWRRVNARLRELLDDEEYAQARSSTLTAFYTPRTVIDAIWSTLDKAGFGRDGNHPDAVLEPGCGTGNFVRSTPRGSSYRFTGIESDTISAGIARHLCPDSDIIHNRMERTGLPSDAFDLAVGNVPYSDAIRIDGTVIHDWFIEHSLGAVRPGGLVAVLTSRYTLDKNTSAMRRTLADQADLVAACRLPRETFGRQAGTEVVSDILILRKRDQGDDAGDASWVDTVPYRDGVAANSLFVEHPEYVAGRMLVGSGPYGPRIDVTMDGRPLDTLGETVERILGRQIEAYGADLHDRLGERGQEPIVNPDVTKTSHMRHTVDDNGRVWYGDMYGTVTPIHSALGPAGDARMADMIRLRDRMERLLALEHDPDADDETVRQGIGALDHAYDAFVEQYGRLNSEDNLRVFDPGNSDPSLTGLYALEKTDSNGFKAKADMLSKRVANPVPPLPDHVDEPAEALAISLDRRGRVDLGLIGRLLGAEDETETLDRLGDLVILDPDDRTPLPADEYLSGDVGGKLAHIDELLDHLVGEPERRREREWMAQNHLDDASIAIADGVTETRDGLRESGAWQSIANPLGNSKAVIPEAYVENARIRSNIALACLLVDDLKPGAKLTDGQNLSAAFDGIVNEYHSDSDQSCSCMRLLYKMVAADPKIVDDGAIAALLATKPYAEHTGFPEAVRSLIGNDLWENVHTWKGDWECRSYIDLAKRLRQNPEICEYLYAADMRRLGDPQISEQHSQYMSWTTKTFRGLEETVDPGDFDRWKSRRAEWMDSWDAGTVDGERVAELRELKARLEQAQPQRLTKDEITAKLGSAWIPPSVIRDFMIDRFGIGSANLTNGKRMSLEVSHDEASGKWQVKSSMAPDLPVEIQQRYGMDGTNLFQIVDGALNSTTSDRTKPDPDNPGRRIQDTEATAMLYEKRHTVEQAFSEWVWEDPECARVLEDVYNARFNRIRPREYDGSYLTFPGISADIDLYPHQRNAVARILQSGEGTLVAHVVGEPIMRRLCGMRRRAVLVYSSAAEAGFTRSRRPPAS